MSVLDQGARLVLDQVLASRAGEVAAATDCFAHSGQSKEFRAKANYVAVRHAPGLYSRYYHLAKKSVRVRVGQRVEAGQLLGRSGWGLRVRVRVRVRVWVRVRVRVSRAARPQHGLRARVRVKVRVS